MELALNVGWLALAAVLCGGCLWARKRQMLRLPFLLALSCSLLLALLLFPAISMTDDLQRANLEMEGRVRCVALLETATLPNMLEAVPMLLLTLLCVGALAQTRLRWLSAPRTRHPESKPCHVSALAVRPPTRGGFALA